MLNSELLMPINTNQADQDILNKIKNAIHEQPKAVNLSFSDGTQIELSQSLSHALQQLVTQLLNGKPVAIMPLSTILTTQEAADILNVSRPYLVKLLEDNEIPFHKVGTHRRVLLSDLLSYKEKFDREQEQGLIELIQLTEELGFYDE